MKTLIALMTVLLVTGCSTMKPITAEVPIAVACKTPTPTPPTYRFQPPYKTVFEGTRDLLGDREISIAYQTQLEAALKSCK